MARVNDPAEMKAIYDTSRLVYSHELSQNAACRLLKEKTSASEASLKMYFSIFSYMRKGKCYKMGTSAPFTKFLIENIYKDYGYEAVLLALASAKQNSEYRIACGNPQSGIEQVCREIITEHQLQVSFEELNQYYNAGSGTLPTETDTKDIVKENSIFSSTITGSLKLRIVIGGVSFEAEGDPKTVVAQEKLFAKEILPSALAAVEHIVSFQPKEPARKEPKASSKKNPKAPSKKETTAKKKRTSVDRRGTGKPVTDDRLAPAPRFVRTPLVLVVELPVLIPVNRHSVRHQGIQPYYLALAVSEYLGVGVSPQQQVGHKCLPEHKRGHFRVRLVVQKQIQRMIQRLFLPAVFVIAVQVERELCNCLRQNTDAGIHRGHLHGGPFRHDFPGSGTAHEKRITAPCGSVLRLIA